MTRKILILLVVCFAAAMSNLSALGLGEIKLKSGLNQPLDAEIKLLSVRGESNEQLKGALGSSVDFERSGIERMYFLTKIRFTTITKPNGQKVLQLTTQDAVREPFLNFLVNLEWPNGRLLREYTLLLDPPIFDDVPEATVTPAAASPKPQPKTRPARVEPAQVASQSQWEGEIYGPTSSSDTLWGIAAKVRPERSISMQRTMVAIFEANPDAFMRGNINNLKRGAEIRIPDRDSFDDISQREAMRLIAAHNENWKSGRQTKPSVVVDTSRDDAYQSQTEKSDYSSGKLSLSTEEAETGTGGSNAAEVLIEEESEVLKQQNKQLQERTQTDAERIKQLERLLELKNEQLANIQSRESKETVVETAPEQTQTAESSTQEVLSKPAEENIRPTPQPQQPAQMSLMDSVMSGAYNLYLAIAAAVVLLLLVIIINRRKNQSIDYKDAVAGNARVVTPSLTETEAQLPEAADDVLAGTDSINFEETAVEDGNTSDPLGEADIYIAYGKFEQAETLLERALEDNPGRTELHSKLLECYAEMDAKDKFEAQIEKLSSAIHSDSELGKYIQELYQTAWPEGELFGSLAETEEVDAVSDDSEEGTDENPEDDFGEVSEEDLEDLSDIDETVEDIDGLDELPSTEDVFGEDVVDDEFKTDDFEEELVDADDTETDDFSEEDFDELDLESEDDDIDTQLDLARAYVEMGDADGTREIIAEVMETGTEEQCEEAQKILDSLED